MGVGWGWGGGGLMVSQIYYDITDLVGIWNGLDHFSVTYDFM
jgi:hypothetical protein